MDFASHAEKTAEAHDERSPFFWVDMGALVSRKEQLLDVQLDNVDLKRVRRDVLSEGTPFVDDALHLHRALRDSRRGDVERGHLRKFCDAEFVGLVAISPGYFLFGHRVLAGGEGQLVHVRHLLLGWQIDDAFTRSNQVVRCLAHGAEAEHASPSQPPCGRHGRDIRRAVLIQSRDQCHWRAEIEDRRFDGSEHRANMPRQAAAIYPLLAPEYRTTYRVVPCSRTAFD